MDSTTGDGSMTRWVQTPSEKMTLVEFQESMRKGYERIREDMGRDRPTVVIGSKEQIEIWKRALNLWSTQEMRKGEFSSEED